jgi:hypothetical protein
MKILGLLQGSMPIQILDKEFAVNDWIQTFESRKPDLKIVA